MSNLYDSARDNQCGHIIPPPPPPPYRPPHGHDSYSHGCYHEYHGHPHPHEFPTHGPMLGSGFMLLNYNPYLFDKTHVKYGNFLSVAENVNTRITRRRDDSCINLDATFNLAGDIIRNAVMQQHLEQSISNHFDTLEGYLPIIKSDITARIYYTVEDDMGGTVHQAVLTVSTPQMNLHFTDIRDYFVTSIKSIFVGNIPAMDYTGMYKLILEKIELFADVIDTKHHVSDNMNPYYQFADNNNKIILQHETIQQEIPDGSILLASLKLHEMIPFQANITTRLRISFVAFMDELIAVPQTFGIWNAMFEPTDEKIDKCLQEIATLKESVMMLTNMVTEMRNSLNDVSYQVDKNTNDIADLNTTVSNLNIKIDNNMSDITARLDDHEYRIRTLEQRPLALVRYIPHNEYVAPQLVYNTYGDIYQTAKSFTATTLAADIAAGNLVPLKVDQTVIVDVTQRVEALETGIVATNEHIDQVEEQLDDYISKFDTIQISFGD